ncbi:MAG: SDR family oxidoreductase [Clostridia bacterium]
MKLANKVAVITGAASGMGKEMAVLFAQEGAKVVVADLNEDKVNAVVSEIAEAGGTATGVVANVAKEEDVQNMIDTAVGTYGSLDILVNNAGIMDNFTPVADISDDLWERVIAVNLTGPFRACRKAVPIMIEQGGGVIINTASIGGLYGSRAGTVYTASKHGVVGLTKNIGFQYGPKGIRCNAIAPGGVNTNITSGASFNAFGMERMSTGMGSNIRSAEPIEIARLALFLASDDSSFINGTVITADAGWTAY